MRKSILIGLASVLAACSGGEGKAELVMEADASVQPCQGETDAELCGARECGNFELSDRCENTRNVSCGQCGSGTCNDGTCEVTQQGCADSCAQGQITACTCGPGDPCGWSGDGYCDIQCQEAFPQNHFDDGVDCPLSINDTLGVSCSDNYECAPELTCHDGDCVCCDDPTETADLWNCHASTIPAIANGVCGTTPSTTVADLYGQAALGQVGSGCYGAGGPSNHWCPPQLQCLLRPGADDYRCGCCADVLGSFVCSSDVSFARTFCLGLSTDCLDGSCLD